MNLRDWFAQAGYGVMVHWTSQSLPQSGNTPQPYCQAVNAFDVQRFAHQLQVAGAAYVFFTISHAQQYFAFPSPTLDAILPGRTCSRDLYDDLYHALHPLGIKMLFYYPSIGTDEDPAWTQASSFLSDPRAFAHHQYTLVEEIGLRYGDKLAGWWIDNCYDTSPEFSPDRYALGERYDFRVYANKLRAGNPQRLVAFAFRGPRSWISSTGEGIQDYQAGESDTLERLPTGRFSGEGNAQWHTVVWMDDNWVHTTPGLPTPRYTNEEVITFTRAVIDGGGIFTYNTAPYQDTLISEATLRQLAALKAAIRNVK